MIISAIKTVFIDVPKAGSSSMTEFLIRSFSSLPHSSNVNLLWNIDLCPLHPSAKQKLNGDVSFSTNRHEPLVSIYKHIPDFHDYFFFTMVRNPFDRFKSFAYETLLHKRFKRPQITPVSRNPYQSFYTDSWFVNDRHSSEEQLHLLITNLHIIKSKGWDNVNLCSIPIHAWPQVNFLSLKTPRPYTLRILPFETMDVWMDDFKDELSKWGGIDVTKNAFPNLDPSPLTIFIEKSNMDSIKTMPYEHEWELKQFIQPGLNPDLEFQAKYPTYDSFIKSYNEEKIKIHEQFGSILEDHRGLIEDVYRDDMITYGYA
jgi:hypothetical protein